MFKVADTAKPYKKCLSSFDLQKKHVKFKNCFYSPATRLFTVFITTPVTFLLFWVKRRIVLLVENVYKIGFREEFRGRTNTAIHT